MRNIILVGFMGTGKTTVAKALAEALNKKYVSTDERIEEMEGRSIPDIFREKGEPYFRKVEAAAIKEICSGLDQVIDTGGGAILNKANFDNFKQNGVMICLWSDPEAILSRTAGSANRPLLNVRDPRKKIQELLEIRRPFYEKSDFHIDTTAGDITSIIAKIIKAVRPSHRHYVSEPSSGLSLWEILLDKLFDNADLSVLVTDKNGKVIFTNSRFTRMFGYCKSDLAGKNWFDVLLPAKGRAGIKKLFFKVSGRKTTCRLQFTALDRRERERKFSWVLTPLNGKKKCFIMFIGNPLKKGSPKTGTMGRAEDKDIVNILFTGSRENEPDTAKHSLRVTSFAVALAKKIGMSKDEVQTIRIAALLHDIGKIAVDDKILLKPGKLSPKEFGEIRNHPGWGMEIIKPCAFLKKILPIVGNHHENFDGSGYPYGLKGAKIPLGARVLSVADLYEALISDRPYRNGFDKETSINIMLEARGAKLDPALTDIFIEMVKKNELKGDISG
jgi:PAS domain S-box-containing protein/putative nucleotidyltransferase with HDIG domain